MTTLRRSFGSSTGKRIAVSLGAALIAGAGPVLAQAPTGTLQEIVVTAQRHEQNIQNVPISVSAVEGERLAAMFEGGDDIRALATRVPSLYAESSNGRLAPRFYIRGLGNTDFDLAASQPVSIIVDDVVLENVVLKSFPLFDIQRVEVLRGPAGHVVRPQYSGGYRQLFYCEAACRLRRRRRPFLWRTRDHDCGRQR